MVRLIPGISLDALGVVRRAAKQAGSLHSVASPLAPLPRGRGEGGLQPGCRAQGVGLVGALPGEGGEAFGLLHLLAVLDLFPLIGHVERIASEVTIGCSRAIHGVQQVQHFGDGIGAQVEVLADQADQAAVVDLASAEGVYGNGGGLCHTNGVRHLDFTAIRQTSCHHVLGDIAAGVGCGTVYLGRILTGERTAAVTGHTAVAVHDDLTAGQTAVAHRAADHEGAGRVDVELGVLIDQLSRNHVLDDEFHHRFFQVGGFDFRVVLGGQHDGVDADHFAVFIAAGDLALGVRAQPGQQAGFTGLGLTLHQTVGVDDRSRHQHVGFVAGVTEHQALVTGTLVFRLGTVHTLGDVHGLLADDVDHATGGTVKAHGGGGVADIVDHATDQLFQVNPGTGGDFAGNDGNAGFDHGFAGHTGVFVLGDDDVEHGIGNLVGNFVRMAFRDRLGGKKDRKSTRLNSSHVRI